MAVKRRPSTRGTRESGGSVYTNARHNAVTTPQDTLSVCQITDFQEHYFGDIQEGKRYP